MVDHRTFTIQSLPNEVLLLIFSFHRLLSATSNCLPSVAWRWHVLVHVCQRWRYLIFGSLRHLGARLVIPRNSLKTPLDSWSALPLSIWHESEDYSEDYMSREQMDNILAAFEHSDRIREMSFSVASCYPLSRLTHHNGSFLTLEHLALSGFRPDSYLMVLPREFLASFVQPRSRFS